ncbi:glycerol-3-phosphate dehydrogenase/oxidase [Microbacterium amylolyticum]|uniref:Glycerol-3-phosphate dehydrogenase n=1 Tax=Microbacterium amylolyticum TaxID=936337 RepID=A0ABS4ZDZ0_9MICO|nr:glycerol-3-phosphate dehydrogenase/oxidase [Microbacterium amylolyticum]MBP2435452.1 glycerol-3-phosphate dehydrogenase [Microbacterium amylolyticum]
MGTSTQSTQERQQVADVRDRGRAQVVIVGGGINGIATFRDLALQGVDVVLIERDDFASGASAASSHMVHGGIRYLENGEFRLVHESVTERNDLLKTAPHFVKPLRTTIPIYSFWSGLLNAPMQFFFRRKSVKQTERGALLIKVGLVLYDVFASAGRSTPWHRFRGRKASLAELPRLNKDLKYTATYFDASMHDPERLALDVLNDGLEANRRARALNYVEAIGRTDNGVVVRDRETGTEFTIAADVIVNASGPWTDLTNEAFGEPTGFMGGTKGSHIVLDNPELSEATGGREIFFEHSDGRVVLIYPLKGRVMVGTTDIPADPREPARCTEEEVDYFFELVASVFPDIPVSRDQIVYRFSGIRPLPASDASRAGQISRDYRVETSGKAGDDRTPVVSLVGGKWTTFRALGESLGDVVLDMLSVPRVVKTKGRAIGGGRDYPLSDRSREVWLRSRVPGAGDRGDILLQRYGTRAERVWDLIEDDHDEPVGTNALSTRELLWMVEREHVVHLTDVLFRRTSIAFTGDATRAELEAISTALAPLLGWDDERRAEEVRRTATTLREEHGVDVDSEDMAGAR